MTRRCCTDAARLLGLFLVVLVAVPDARAQSDVQPFFGVTVNGVFRNGKLKPATGNLMREQAEAGIPVGRTDAFWVWVEPRAPKRGRHTYSFERTDTIAQAMAEQGIRWQPVLDYGSSWDISMTGVGDKAPPVGNANFAGYAAAVVARYGRGGSFWRERPWLRSLPAVNFEVWNEPNGEWFWRPRPDAARYASLLLAAADAVHGVDPAARVIVGGLVPGDAASYARAVFEAQPALRAKVNGVGLHPYADRAEKSVTWVRALRGALDDVGLTGMPIDVTEIGWPTQGVGKFGAPPIPDETRAANLTLTADALAGSDCGVRSFFPYTWVSAEKDEEYDEDWMGILNRDLTPSETSAAYGADIARQASKAAAAAAGTPPARPLRVCDRADPASVAAPLRIGLDVGTRRDAEQRCYDAVVTFRGRPLNYVAVTYDYVATSRTTARVAADSSTRVKTGVDGKASWCITLPDDGLRRTVEISAEIPRIAAATAVEKGLR
jgi:hypothetical protein